ncbi:MAG: hypothetical protein ACFFDB_00690 [Promethearchaeota archaeon]
MNSQHKVFLFGVILLLSCIIPYTLFFMGEVSESVEEEDGSGENEAIPPLANNEGRYPDDYFINVSNVQFIEGTNSGANSLDELDLIDYQFFGIIPSYNGTKYNYDVRFDFDIDYEVFNGYFYLQIAAPLFPSEIVEVQVNNSQGWETLYYISNNVTNINRTYVEYATQFRIFGSIDTISKILLIDRMVFAFGQDGDIITKNDFNIVDYNIEYFYMDGNVVTDQRDNDWWVSVSDNLNLIGETDYCDDFSKIIYEVRLYLNDVGDPKIDSINKIREIGFTYWKHYNSLAIFQSSTNTKVWIMNWQTGYDLEKEIKGKNVEYHKDVYVNWTSDVASNPNDYIMIDPNGRLYWQYKIQSKGMCGGGGNHKLIQKYAVSDVEVLREEAYVPEVYTVPNTPVSTSASFQVRLDAGSEDLYYPIESVKYQIQNKTWIKYVGYHIEESTLYGNIWWEMKYDSGTDTWYSVYLDKDLNEYEFFNISEWRNGNYTTWVNVTNSQKVSTYGYYDFEISNKRPVITYFTPSTYLEKVSQLYNYDIKAHIIDPELDDYDNVSIRIYNNPSDPIIDWDNMTRISTTDVWNYTIQPILYENGVYTIEIKAKDFIGYGQNSTQVLIQNNPPNIEILSPLETELTMIIQGLKCNISNEEVINTAEWDITDTIGNYVWKNLTYNITSEFWEDTFSLLDYKYGDYYLVINATDDKYNSSLEIKSLQFHPLLTYYIPPELIYYIDNNIKVSSVAGGSDEITGSFMLLHHPIAEERDFEVYIPEEYEDAHEYYLTRGYQTHYPTGFNVKGVYTLWNLLTWEDRDVIYFKLDSPKIINTPFEEKDGDYELLFTLSAKHSFTNLKIENALDQYIPDPENYEYAVYYKFGGDWVEIDDIKVDPSSGSVKFSYTWNSINENSTIEFRFTAIQLDIEETDWTPIIVAATLGAFGIGISVFIIFGFKKHEDWGKVKSILLSIGIGAAAGIIGYLIVIFI